LDGLGISGWVISEGATSKRQDKDRNPESSKWFYHFGNIQSYA